MGDLTDKGEMEYEVSRRGILAACEALHMLHTGAMDNLDAELRWNTCREFLQRRLESWSEKPSDHGPHAGEYDAAVKNIMVCALKLETSWSNSWREEAESERRANREAESYVAALPLEDRLYAEDPTR